MGDLDLDELERLCAAASTRERNAWLVYVGVLVKAAPALIAAARAAQHRGETLERIAEAVGYPRDAHYGDVLGRLDEIVAERDRLRALCREAAGYLGRQHRDLTEAEDDLCERLRAAEGES